MNLDEYKKLQESTGKHRCEVSGAELDTSMQIIELDKYSIECLLGGIEILISGIDKDIIIKMKKESEDCDRLSQADIQNTLDELIDDQGSMDRRLKWIERKSDKIIELEKNMKVLNKYISDCDKQRFDADEVLRERIDRLVRNAATNTTIAISRFKSLEDRILALEEDNEAADLINISS